MNQNEEQIDTEICLISQKSKDILISIERVMEKSHVRYLKKLILPHNLLGKIPSVISELWALEHLNLCNNGLEDLPEDISELKR